MSDARSGPEMAPSNRERVFNIPPAVSLVILGLMLVHVGRLAMPDRWNFELLSYLAFVPGRLTFAIEPAWVTDPLLRLATGSAEELRQAQVDRFFLGDGSTMPWTVLTYGLMHADWAHVGLNCLWLLAFGTPVARRLGPLRFAMFLALTTFTGAVAHYVTHVADLQPVIGASAAVSGCMGAALRFAFQPSRTLSADMGLPGGTRPRQPLLPIAGIVRDRRAATFFLVWFLTNLVFGLGSGTLGGATPTIAWQAHIGGFLAGLLLLPIFDGDPDDAVRDQLARGDAPTAPP